MSTLTIIVATDQQGGIGLNNTLPWKLPEDLAHFKSVTTGHPIIMGRKTFDSIGRPLPNRRNIVITHNTQWKREGVETAASVEAALAMLDGADGYVIGGAQIYKQSLAMADRLIITEIDGTYDCDAVFPTIDRTQWNETARQDHVSVASGLKYAFVTLQRKA
ncbi:dihydrofolate reductase [Janthinobacterium sp. PSPC3-1]|uniref:dihydrofolate reductase n=1 Tax=Janthinobacterium sp. PSPC3-1 TaxID=2804653 RepID=UPI003CEC43BA